MMRSTLNSLVLVCLLICACYQGHDDLSALTGIRFPDSYDSAARAGAPAQVDAAISTDAGTPSLPPCAPAPEPSVDAATAELDSDAGSAESSVRAVSVSTYTATTCALVEGGTVRCWGDNSQGTLGEGTYIDSARPVQVHELQDVVHLDVGLVRACAVTAAGELCCWGDNTWDVLRVGDQLDHNIPVTAQGVENAAQVSLGEQQTCVRYADNTLDCWGYPHVTELVVQGERNVAAVEAGYFLTTATLLDGSVRSWGQNDLGGPVDVSTSRAVSSGYAFVCVLAQDATVTCHGTYNVHEVVDSVVGVVPGVSDVVSMSSGFEHTCAVTRAGKVYCWGRNNRGQLGDGGTVYRTDAREVAQLESVVEVTCGREHSCARTADGRVYCWGSNAVGELGDGTTTERHTPVRVLGF